MCGIAGFVNLEGHRVEEVRPLLAEMTRLLAHRGPDEEGFYLDQFAALGHRRLAIIDLSSGKQPMKDEETGSVIVFNGEIYNFLELREELLAKGYCFSTKSDTEVILKAYQAWGPDCVQRLYGMFAFALWDGQERKLFLARDRLGKKPLYYWLNGPLLVFASEIKSLLAFGAPRELGPEAIDCYFSFGYIPSPLTIFRAIRKLPPAHALIFSDNDLKEFRYWEIKFAPWERPLKATLKEFWPLFEEAVRTRLISEVPLGAFLSGGIDSPLVVAKMQEILRQPVLTNSIGFDDPRLNELPVAREIAAHLGTEHREFVVKPDVKDVLPKLAWHFDEPLADSSAVPTYYVCQMARQNVTVALSGDGGDESFGGYTFRYIPHLWESRLRGKIPLPLRSLVFCLLGKIYPRSSRLPKPLRLKTILQNLAVSDAKAFYRDLVWLPPEIREKIYTAHFLKELSGFSPYEIVHPIYTKGQHLDPVSRCQYVDLHLYLPEDVLVKVDRMSMAVALEVRSPLLDHRLVEFAASLPLELKVQGRKGKILLREAVKHYFPEEIVNRPKQGFSIPEAEWLRGKLRPLIEEVFQNSHSSLWNYFKLSEVRKLWEKHLSGRENHSVFFWALMMYSLWERHYLN